LYDEIWEVRFHLDGKDNIERKIGRSDVTYGWGDNMYYVREEGNALLAWQ
jgi:hypothetical protein